VSRHDNSVARFVLLGSQDLEEVRRAVDGLRQLQRRIARESKVKLSDREVRAAIDFGRP
jgi:hypothetical protein